MSEYTWDFGDATPVEYRCGRCGDVLSQAEALAKIAELERDIETYDGMALNDSFRIERLEAENASLTEKVERLQKTNGEFRKQVALLKEHLGPEGNYSIRRADGKTMWLGETFIIGNIFEALDALLAKDGE